MSADLFAEFGASPPSNTSTTSNPAKHPASQPFSFFDDFQTPNTSSVNRPQILNPAASQSRNLDDADDWGDFEGAPSYEPQSVEQKSDPVYQQSQPSQAINPSQPRKPKDPNVLFDAEDDEDEDDFGDFEAPEPSPTIIHPAPDHTPLEDLSRLRISITAPKKDTVLDLISPSEPPSKPARLGSIPDSKQIKESVPVSSSSKEKTTATWDTFDDWEASIPINQPKNTVFATKKPTKSEKMSPMSLVLSSSIRDPEPGELPPINIPPPGVVLSLFLPIFAEAQEKLFKPMAAQPLPMRNKLLSDPATLTFLQGYLSLASVTGRIIAGRKLRWKRDKHLAQGMKIGPASSRATSGMKLVGIEKGEAMKEEREVLDVVRAWRDQLGRLRHVVAALNSSNAGVLGHVPELQETMPVRTLKEIEGGIPARQQCMLCGLKRNERVDSVDQAVEDSFGEWWVEQVSMHRACRNFWEEHKETLLQR
ncbi:hypothetical protein GQ43DRAFT_374623 [Delitschia confertaspora ATCC 74209]|uniref:Uncharacterized protein n=1 Tax=Delitschia confertaspora ATCC 74209 TaxID=1513339 RepID=A0A9P4MRN0_9PLEO|nr:hypothetical protein GQ43DRAFT_374623 [Delitschia confertaspora ATCC 74209]